MACTIRRLSPWLAGGMFALALPASVALAVDFPLPGKVAVTRRNRSTDESKLTQFLSRAPRSGPLFAIPTAGGGDDPTLVGATFASCITPDPGTWGTISLPAAGWRGLGNPPGSKGYRYKGAGTLADPCRRVIVRPRTIRATCRGPGAVDPLFTIPVGTDSVTHTLTLGSMRYCTLFSPPFNQDNGTRNVWKDRNAPAPALCPSAATPTPSPSPTPTPSPSPTPTPTPTPPYGSASQAFLIKPASLLR